MTDLTLGSSLILSNFLVNHHLLLLVLIFRALTDGLFNTFLLHGDIILGFIFLDNIIVWELGIFLRNRCWLVLANCGLRRLHTGCWVGCRHSVWVIS